MKYAVVDVGAKRGTALDYAIQNIPYVFPPLDRPAPDQCLCIDSKAVYGDDIKPKGYWFQASDVTKPGFEWPEADIFLAFNFLEHLASTTAAVEVLRLMMSRASRAVWIRTPNFEPGREADWTLVSKGLRLTWTHWLGHRAHLTLDQIHRAVSTSPGWKITRTIMTKTIVTTGDPSVVPDSAPLEAVAYDPMTMKPKPPETVFLLPVVAEWELILTREAAR